MDTLKFPIRYLPKMLSSADKQKQVGMLLKSRKLYKKGKFYTRKNVPSYQHKESQHLVNARRIYDIQNVVPGPELARKTGCSVNALQKIVAKGEGAYYSSGSRPNQSPQSWGFARLASAITAGKSAAVDYDIIRDGCNHKKKAYVLANRSRKKYGHGHRGAKRVQVKM
jgi:hypothetical protein